MRLTLARVLFAFGIVLLALAHPAGAEYPEQPIRLVLQFAPGGETDPIARALSQSVSKSIGQPIVIENRPGAAGNIAFDMVAKAPKDGYTLLWGFSTPMVVNPSMYKSLPFSVERDFVPIAMVAEGQFVLVVNPSVAAKSVKELIAYAKANPGKLTYASTGVGSPLHLAGELFMARTGIKLLHVPYKSGGDAARAVLAGETDLLFGSIAGSKPNIDAGKVRALAVTGPKRLALVPDLPTIEEAGLPGFVVTAWHSVLAPAGTPKPIVEKLRREFAKALTSAELKDAMDKLGVLPAAATNETFFARVRDEEAMWRKVIQDAGIKPE